MQVFMPSRMVRWDEIRIPARGENGELTYIKPMPDAVCIGFVPLFLNESDARERFPDEAVNILVVNIEGGAAEGAVEEDSQRRDDEKHESSLE